MFAAGDLVRDLMKVVREMGLMKKHYLGMFLLPQLQQLDLSLFETSDPVLRAIGDRCKVWNTIVLNVTKLKIYSLLWL